MAEQDTPQDRSEEDELGVLKDAISDLEQSIADFKSESLDPAEDSSSSAGSSVSGDAGEIAEHDLGSIDPISGRLGSDLPDEGAGPTKAKELFEELGSSMKDQAVRGPLIKQALAKSWRRTWRKRTIGGTGETVDLRRTKLSMSSAASANQAIDPNDEEALVSRRNRIGFEEDREEEVLSEHSVRELRTALLISRIVAAIVLGFTVVAIFLLATRKGEDVDASQAKPIEDWTDQHRLVDTARETVSLYVEKETPIGRAAYIQDRERVQPLLERYYESQLFPIPARDPGITVVGNRVKSHHSELPLDSTLTGYQDRVGRMHDLVLVPNEAQNRLLIDWEASVGYNEVSISEHVTTRNGESVDMRLLIVPGDYYNFQFSDRRQYQSYVIKVLDDSEPRVFAFAHRDSDAQETLSKFYANKGAKVYAMTLKVRFPPGEDPVAEVLEVVKPHWQHKGGLE